MRTSPLPAKLRNSTGFNLIEVVVALAVVSIGMVALLGLIPVALDAGRNAMDRTVAATIVQQHLADLRGIPFKDLENTYGPYYYAQDGFATNAESPGVSANPPYFRVNVTTAPRTGVSAPIRAVSAVVSWRVNPDPSRLTDPTPSSEVFVTQIAQYAAP